MTNNDELGRFSDAFVRETRSPRTMPEGTTINPGPHRNLLLGILNTALGDIIQLGAKTSEDDRKDAWSWMHCGRDDPWSFNWVCDLLDMNASSVRASVAAGRIQATREAISYINKRKERYLETRSAKTYTKKAGRTYGRSKHVTLTGDPILKAG